MKKEWRCLALKPSDKEIVMLVTTPGVSAEVLDQAKVSGIRRLLTREPPPPAPPDGMSFVRISDQRGQGFASWVKISGAADLERAVEAGARDQSFVVVECSDWTIIPLENLVAEFRRRDQRLYAYASSKEEIQTAFTVLEKGVDGVVVPTSVLPYLREALPSAPRAFPLVPAEVNRVVDAGLGERACVDTTSQLQMGEGMLVGSRASFFFLVHGETISSEYIPTRPFRVNAGALHSYFISPDGKTRYLSELEPPDRVAVVDRRGSAREASVGRVKIERRPLVLVEASTGEASGTVILQKAETIRLVRADGSTVSVTELKPGDQILVHAEEARARHFGGEVDEYIQEK